VFLEEFGDDLHLVINVTERIHYMQLVVR